MVKPHFSLDSTDGSDTRRCPGLDGRVEQGLHLLISGKDRSYRTDRAAEAGDRAEEGHRGGEYGEECANVDGSARPQQDDGEQAGSSEHWKRPRDGGRQGVQAFDLDLGLLLVEIAAHPESENGTLRSRRAQFFDAVHELEHVARKRLLCVVVAPLPLDLAEPEARDDDQTEHT